MRYVEQDPVILFLMLLIFLGTFFQNIPPLRLAWSGYGELVLAIVYSNLVPGISFFFQSGEMHRLLAMSTFPLAFFYLSMAIINGLEMYSIDLRNAKDSLLIRMGWQRGMMFHNIILLCGFLLLGITAIFGMPIGIILPTFLLLPLGVYQVRMIIRIGDGLKPNWAMLRLNSMAIFGLTAYLLTYAYWTR
jgi:1,4-dihydroxy-2-naphthoate octaprenyltransferase